MGVFVLGVCLRSVMVLGVFVLGVLVLVVLVLHVFVLGVLVLGVLVKVCRFWAWTRACWAAFCAWHRVAYIMQPTTCR